MNCLVLELISILLLFELEPSDEGNYDDDAQDVKDHHHGGKFTLVDFGAGGEDELFLNTRSLGDDEGLGKLLGGDLRG